MTKIPAIGGARGLFEIFVPGVFLLLNVGIAYNLLYTETEMGKDIKVAVSDPVSSVVVIICFGYLTGLLLRLFSTDRPDEWSAKLHRILGSKTGTPEKFPYIGRVGERCKKYLPLDVQEFYSQVWKDRKQKNDRENKMFFNFCKTVNRLHYLIRFEYR